MPACTTSELRDEVSSPIAAFFSRTSTSRPASASSRAMASPTTPAPMTTMSNSGSMLLPLGGFASLIESNVRGPPKFTGGFSMPDTVPQRSPDELARFAAAIRSRRSIDLFEPDPPGTERLLEAIELARWAPNHRLTQPWRFYVLGRETADAIVDLAVEIETAAQGERAGEGRGERWAWV